MLKIQENIALAPYTTYRIGGIARYFAEVKSTEELLAVLQWAVENQVQYFILGLGANVLFAAAEYPGLVILNRSQNFTLEEDDHLLAESGVNLATLIDFTVKNGLGGLEYLAGIPSTIGGALRGNAGIPERNIGELVSWVEVWRDGHIYQIPRNECSFEYRDSIFKHNHDIILRARLKLIPCEKGVLEKRQIDMLVSRKAKCPLGHSCGSFFKNPYSIQKTAGELIEQVGLKGAQFGDAMISDRHANWIVNTGHATAKDILTLARMAHERVYAEFGILLEPEVQIVGDDL